MTLTYGLLVVAAFVVLVLLLAALRRITDRRLRDKLPYYSRKYLLTKGENAFYQVLRNCIPPGVSIAPKVRVSDLIACDAAAWNAGYGGRISQKHVDFVLVDSASTAVLCVIELDDKTHRQYDRRDRDQFVNDAFECAGIRMVRVPAASGYDSGAVRVIVRRGLEKEAANMGQSAVRV